LEAKVGQSSVFGILWTVLDGTFSVLERGKKREDERQEVESAGDVNY
jgi:hypothetical protein